MERTWQRGGTLFPGTLRLNLCFDHSQWSDNPSPLHDFFEEISTDGLNQVHSSDQNRDKIQQEHSRDQRLQSLNSLKGKNLLI